MDGRSSGNFNRRAFSLIELLLVVAILAIFAAITAPRYAASLNRFRAEAAARRIAYDLSFAQSRARSMSAARTITFNVSGNSYQLTGEADLTSPTNTYSVNLAADPYFVSITTLSFGGNPSVTFNGYGVPNTAGYVQIGVGGLTKQISIDADSGATTIQ